MLLIIFIFVNITYVAMVRELIELNNKNEVNATTTPEHNMNINNVVIYFVRVSMQYLIMF